MFCPPGYITFDRIVEEVLDFIDFYYPDKERANGGRDVLLCKYLGMWASLPQCRSLSAFHPREGLAGVSPRMVYGIFEYQPRPTYQGFFFIDATTGIIKPDRFADRLSAARQAWGEAAADDDPFRDLDSASGARVMSDQEADLMAVLSAADYFEEFFTFRGWWVTCMPEHAPGEILLPAMRRHIHQRSQVFGPLTTHKMALLSKGVTMEELARIPYHKQMGEAYEAYRLKQEPLQVAGSASADAHEKQRATRSRKKFERVKRATLKVYPDGLGTDEIQYAMTLVLAEVGPLSKFSEKLFLDVRKELWPDAPGGT